MSFLSSFSRPLGFAFVLLLFTASLAQAQKKTTPGKRAANNQSSATQLQEEEYAFTQISERAYQQAFDKLWPLGYRPDQARVETVKGQVRFSLRMRKPKVPIDCHAKHLLTDQKFKEADDEYQARDFKLRVHETFDWNGTQRHLAIWIRESKAKPLGEIWKSAKRIPANGKTHRRYKALDDLYKGFLFENQVPGATVAVAYQGKLIYERGFGYSNLDGEKEMMPATRLRIASISKPITAAAIMRLVDQRKLSLSEPVFQKILAPKKDPVDSRLQDITVHHLLRHRGGWDRNQSYDAMFIQNRVAEYFKTKTPVGTDKIIEYMMTQRLEFEPGAREAYSNFGYCVLGRVIEKVTGMNYEDYVRKEILDPIDAQTMVIGGTLKSELLDDEAHYFSRSGQLVDSIVEPGKSDQPRQYGGWHLKSLDSHGGWISSAGDLVKFASAFDKPDDCPFMSVGAMKTMFVPIDLNQLQGQQRATKRYYAYGWRVVLMADGRANTYHSGKLSGTSTMLVRRHDGFTWAILFNCGSDLNGKTLSSKIDGLMHNAVNAIKK